MIKVKDERGLVRDPVSKAIIRTDYDSLQEHRKKKAIMRQSIENSGKVDALDKRINNIEQQISEIKQMMIQFLSK